MKLAHSGGPELSSRKFDLPGKMKFKLLKVLIIINVFLLILTLFIPAGFSQDAPKDDFTVNDIKVMLADRDIVIERQSRLLAGLQKELESLKKEKEKTQEPCK